MVVEQYYLGCLAHASYLIADQEAGEAAVVDPQRDVEQYLDDAARLGCRVAHVFLTHLHADFLAGHLELRDRAHATIYLGSRAAAEYSFKPMGDGEEMWVGGVRLKVLQTPGLEVAPATQPQVSSARPGSGFARERSANSLGVATPTLPKSRTLSDLASPVPTSPLFCSGSPARKSGSERLRSRVATEGQF